MSTTYTGIGGNVTQSTSPTITVPSDGDSLAVTSVNVAMDKLMDYIALLFGGAQTGQAAGTPGYSGTGGSSAQGVKATAGGGGSPVKGALGTVVQVAPSSPDNGDWWVTSASAFARVNGVTKDILKAQVWLTYSTDLGTVTTGQNNFIPASGVSTGATIATSRIPGRNTYVVADAGKLGTVRGFASVAPTVNMTVTIFKNGATTGTAGTWNSASTTFSFDASAVSVVAGDTIEVVCTLGTTNSGIQFIINVPINVN